MEDQWNHKTSEAADGCNTFQIIVHWL